MNTKKKAAKAAKQTAKAVMNEFQSLTAYFSPAELEDVLFRVFAEANLHSDLCYPEKEKRTMLHAALRRALREMNKMHSPV